MLNIIAIGCEAASGEPCFLFSQAAFAAPLRSGHFRNGRDVDQQIRLGDEAKYWNSYQVGLDAIFVDKVEKDHKKNISQASLTIKDPASGQAIGAVTVGIDVDKLK